MQCEAVKAAIIFCAGRPLGELPFSGRYRQSSTRQDGGAITRSPFQQRYTPYNVPSPGRQQRIHYTMRERQNATRDRYNHVRHHALQPREVAGGLQADRLAYWGQVHQQWKHTDAAFVPEAAACCICGRWAFGGRYSRLRHHFKEATLPVDQFPIGATANPFLSDKMKNGAASVDCSGTAVQKWWLCQACHGNTSRQQQQQQLQVPMTPQHARDICELLTMPGGALLYGSVLRCPVRFQKRADTLLHATPTAELPVIGGPLVAFDGSDQQADPARVAQVRDKIYLHP